MASEGRNRGIREIRGSRQGKRFPFLFRVFRVVRGLIPVTTVPRSKSSPPASKLDYCSAKGLTPWSSRTESWKDRIIAANSRSMILSRYDSVFQGLTTDYSDDTDKEHPTFRLSVGVFHVFRGFHFRFCRDGVEFQRSTQQRFK